MDNKSLSKILWVMLYIVWGMAVGFSIGLRMAMPAKPGILPSLHAPNTMQHCRGDGTCYPVEDTERPQ